MDRILITWEPFTIAFLEIIFPTEMREDKVKEFINFKQLSITVREYSLKFFKLSRFLIKISEIWKKECWAAMLHNNMDLSRLMVHV